MEGTILLSRIIKSRTSSFKESEAKVIGIKEIPTLLLINETEVSDPLELEKRKILDQYHHEAKGILINAKQEADEIRRKIEDEKAKWAEEKAKLIEEAKLAGLQQGISEGRAQGYEQYKQQIEIANQIVDDIKQEYSRHIEAAEKVILQLGMKAAEKILDATLNEQPEKFVSLVKQVLREAREYKEVQIYVHPNQFSFVSQCKEELDAILTTNQQCYLYPNDHLNEFQCLIETSHGRIDASIDSQLLELKTKLMEIIEGVQS